MNKSLTIRVPHMSEIRSLPEIESRADAVYREDPFSEHMGVSSVEELQQSLSAHLLFIAELNGQIVGFAMSRILGNYVHLQQLSVIPEEGQKGIGTSLLKKIIEEVELKNHPGITLTTFDNVAWNAPFYKKRGFEEVKDFTHYPELLLIHESEKSIGLENRVGMIRKSRNT